MYGGDFRIAHISENWKPPRYPGTKRLRRPRVTFEEKVSTSGITITLKASIKSYTPHGEHVRHDTLSQRHN